MGKLVGELNPGLFYSIGFHISIATIEPEALGLR